MIEEKMFEGLVNVSEESIKEMIFILNKLNVERIISAKSIPGQYGMMVELCDDSEKKYYVGMSSYGAVEIIRADSITGKIIYMPIDD